MHLSRELLPISRPVPARYIVGASHVSGWHENILIRHGFTFEPSARAPWCSVSQMNSSTSGQETAFTILREFERAHSDLLGKAVVLSDGKAGVIENVFLDELHGLRIAVKGHKGNWPISTVRYAE
jgi:hypothetical protein